MSCICSTVNALRSCVPLRLSADTATGPLMVRRSPANPVSLRFGLAALVTGRVGISRSATAALNIWLRML